MKTTPRCSWPHGKMVRRPKAGQTPEQLFCGTWWDCTRCHGSVLIPSNGLKKQWAAMGIKS